MSQDVQECYFKLKGPKFIVACTAAKPTKKHLTLKKCTEICTCT
jgi:hypothetical protein